MNDTVVIERRYRGPPDSANGGYACGVVANRLSGSARVRLHRPPPLDEPMTIRTTDSTAARMLYGEDVIADGIAIETGGGVPEPVDVDAAAAAATRFRWYAGHPFSSCFVCGPERDAGDGLRIFPGPIPERRIVAAPWTPDASVCDESGRVRPEVVWAALDCPSWFGLLEFEPGTTAGLLGQLHAHIERRPLQDEPCIALGWPLGREGRKLHAGAALYTASGELLGRSTAVWIEPRLPFNMNVG